MPIYEYQCSACEKITEAMQKFSDPPLTQCPECGGEMKRLVSRTSFQLKGSGWYATDYKKSTASPATSAKPSTPETAKPSGGSGSSGGSEPA